MSSTFEQEFAAAAIPQASYSQDELIREFRRLDALVKERGAERREIGLQIAGIAFENKGAQNTVHLESTDGQKVKVEFGSETDYDTELMMDVVNLLGKERFDALFKTKIEFVPKKRELNKFLNTVSAEEKVETAKQIIKDACTTRDKTPYVSCE